MPIPEVDFTDEIAVRIEEILQEFLPEELAVVEAPLTPPEPTSYRQGSILLWLEPNLLPCISIEDEPPGGFRPQKIGIGIDHNTGLPAIEGHYTFLIHYALEFRPTEIAHRVVRKAAATVQKILIRHALIDLEVGWKDGWVREVYSGRATGAGKSSDLVFCVGTCVFTCEKHVVPTAPFGFPGFSLSEIVGEIVTEG